MKQLKRILALVLALVLVLGLAACNKGGGDSPNGGGGGGASPEDPNAALEKKLKGVEKVKLDHVYKVEYLSASLPSGENESHYIQGVQEAGGDIYISGSYSRQTPSQEYPGSYDYDWGVEVFRLKADGTLELLKTFTQESDYDEENSRSTESYVNSISIAPMTTEAGIIRRWSLPSAILQACRTTSPTNPIIPTKATQSEVRTDATTMVTLLNLFTLSPSWAAWSSPIE